VKAHILHSSDLPWRDKIIPKFSPDRRGCFKNLAEQHGLTQFDVRITLIPPGETNTWQHSHSCVEEWFFVLHGTCHVHIDGRWLPVHAGDSIATSPGDFHMFRNFGDTGCEIIMVGKNDDSDAVERIAEPEPPPLP